MAGRFFSRCWRRSKAAASRQPEATGRHQGAAVFRPPTEKRVGWKRLPCGRHRVENPDSLRSIDVSHGDLLGSKRLGLAVVFGVKNHLQIYTSVNGLYTFLT